MYFPILSYRSVFPILLVLLIFSVTVGIYYLRVTGDSLACDYINKHCYQINFDGINEDDRWNSVVKSAKKGFRVDLYFANNEDSEKYTYYLKNPGNKGWITYHNTVDKWGNEKYVIYTSMDLPKTDGKRILEQFVFFALYKNVLEKEGNYTRNELIEESYKVASKYIRSEKSILK